MWKIILIILAILYTLNPYDILPDFMIGWGWLDDLVVLGLLGRYLYKLKKKREAFQKYHQSDQNAYGYNNANSDSGKGSRTDTNSGTSSNVWDPYKILGVDRSASQENIKHAYRLLAGKYHPDKVAHLGDEFKAMAEKRFKEIQRAYQELRSK
jgi:DnaJ like chaperone protein